MGLVGWMPEQNRETLDRLIREHDIKTVIEIGAFVELSTVFFAERCERVISVETFFLENTIHYPNVTGLSMESLEAALLPIEADLIYIDAGHDYARVRADIKAWMPKARKILCGDDYTDNWPGVKKAVDQLGSANTDQRVWYFIKGAQE